MGIIGTMGIMKLSNKAPFSLHSLSICSFTL